MSRERGPQVAPYALDEHPRTSAADNPSQAAKLPRRMLNDRVRYIVKAGRRRVNNGSSMLRYYINVSTIVVACELPALGILEAQAGSPKALRPFSVASLTRESSITEGTEPRWHYTANSCGVQRAGR